MTELAEHNKEKISKGKGAGRNGVQISVKRSHKRRSTVFSRSFSIVGNAFQITTVHCTGGQNISAAAIEAGTSRLESFREISVPVSFNEQMPV